MVEMSMDRWMKPGEFTLDWRASAGSGFMIDSVRLCGWGPADGMLEGIGGFDADGPMGLGVEDRAGRVPERLTQVPADATLGDVAGMVGRGIVELDLSRDGDRGLWSFVPDVGPGPGDRRPLFSLAGIGEGMLVSAAGRLRAPRGTGTAISGTDIIGLADALHGLAPVFGRGMRILGLAMEAGQGPHPGRGEEEGE